MTQFCLFLYQVLVLPDVNKSCSKSYCLLSTFLSFVCISLEGRRCQPYQGRGGQSTSYRLPVNNKGSDLYFYSRGLLANIPSSSMNSMLSSCKHASISIVGSVSFFPFEEVLVVPVSVPPLVLQRQGSRPPA